MPGDIPRIFALEQLGDNFEETFTATQIPSGIRLTIVTIGLVLTVDDHKHGSLRLLVERFGLVPWQEPKRKFERLQAAYIGKLRISTEDEGSH